MQLTINNRAGTGTAFFSLRYFNMGLKTWIDTHGTTSLFSGSLKQVIQCKTHNSSQRKYTNLQA